MEKKKRGHDPFSQNLPDRKPPKPGMMQEKQNFQRQDERGAEPARLANESS